MDAKVLLSTPPGWYPIVVALSFLINAPTGKSVASMWKDFHTLSTSPSFDIRMLQSISHKLIS
ncbi:hypothetical protein VKT23_019187 [Stygiomarasmius scandens]|uniref:Uncharacterized protein n=1 Tax=Marasmiellus scandens TaxID=2682957 RepID=A0ABR1IM00_9AGAR